MHQDILASTGLPSLAPPSKPATAIRLAELHFQEATWYPGVHEPAPPLPAATAVCVARSGQSATRAPAAMRRARLAGPSSRHACHAVLRITEELLALDAHRSFVGEGRRAVSRTRHIAMYVAHVALGICLQRVGEAFGRDRSTVRYCCGVIEDRRDDRRFDAFIELLERLAQAAFVPECGDHG